MKKLLLILLVLTSSFLNAQNAQEIIDGLKKELRTNPDDKKRATIYSDLTWYYSNVSIDSALSYGNKAIFLATKLKDSTLIAQVYSDLGAVYFGNGNFEKSKNSYLNAYKIRKLLNDSEGLIKINFNLASIYTKQDDYNSAVKTYLETLKYYENKKNDTLVSVIKSNIASVFLEMNNFSKTYKYANEAIFFQEKNKLYDRLCSSYMVLGNYYIKKNDTLLGLKYYTKTLEVAKKANNNMSISAAYQSLGEVKSVQKKSKEALYYFNQSKEILKTLNSVSEIAFLDLNIAIELMQVKKYFGAKEILLSSKMFYENENSKGPLIDIYKQLSIVSSFLNQPDSTNLYIEKYSTLKILLSQTEIVKQTAELETKYQTEKKEKLILQQQTESKQKNIWLILISSIATIGLLLFRQQRLKSRQQKEQSRLENELLQEQSNFKIQEQRLEISRELHDSVGSQLTFIISILDNLKNAPVKLENAIEKKIDNLSGYANNTISELRDTIWALNTDNLTISELETRILNFVKEASESVETIHFDFKNNSVTNFQLTSKQGINLFRVVQEAVNNAVKHSKASQINIILDEKENQLSMKIQDNGKGFDYEEKKKKSYGLTNLQNRTRELNGTFDLISNDVGTSINTTIPISK